MAASTSARTASRSVTSSRRRPTATTTWKATAATAFPTFHYDQYSIGEHIIPRVVLLEDHTPGSGSANDQGLGNLIHGEAGDDTIFGGPRNDVLYGDGQNDNIVGGAGNDWISG